MFRPKKGPKAGPLSPRMSAKVAPCPESGIALADGGSKKSLCEAFSTALKVSHSLVSICARYDSSLSRFKRLTLYLLRTFAMVTIGVLFFMG